MNNATDSDGDPLTYRFEVYADPFLLLLVTASPEVTQGTTQTNWVVTPTLQENHLYWWRVRAKDSHNLAGGWMTTAAFQVNGQNDPPTAPIPVLPLNGATVMTATPVLRWLDGLDPEGASLTYQVQVYSDSALTKLVASVSGLPGTPLTTSWTVTPALTSKTTYYWRVRANDGQLFSAWSATQTFKVTKLAMGDNIQFAATKSAGLRVATIGSLSGLTGSPTEAIFFYHTDHLGTPLMMTDRTGQVVWKAEYLPFGEPVSINEDVDGDGVKVTNNLRFPGQYYDTESGLHYNMARNYQSMTGRYVEADPVGIDWGQGAVDLGDGINHLYRYVSNNPLRFADPLGSYDEEVHERKTYEWSDHVFREKWTSQEYRVADVAKTIAEADQSMDKNFWTRPENFITGTWRHFRDRLAVYGDLHRTVENCDYKRFGQQLHSLQDAYAHAGFSWPWTLGHLFAGTAPDHYDEYSSRDIHMEADTKGWLSELARKCQCQ